MHLTYHNAPRRSSHHSLSCHRIVKTCSDICYSLDSISGDYHNLGSLQIYTCQILGKYIKCKKYLDFCTMLSSLHDLPSI